MFDNNDLIIGAVCTALIIIIFIMAYWHTSTHEDYMYGFWVADDEFCEESEIDSMLVFIGAEDGGVIDGLFTKTRTCYIVIMNGLSNQGFTLEYKKSPSTRLGKYTIEARPVFDDEKIWPDVVTIETDIKSGTMRIFSHDSASDSPLMWARLNKQHDITNLARAQEGAELVDL